jgi:hypothetical protein
MIITNYLGNYSSLLATLIIICLLLTICSLYCSTLSDTMEDAHDECPDDNILSIHNDVKMLPSRRTMYLNRDFLKQGHVKLAISAITDVTVYMWTNRYVKDLVVNRDNIPRVDEDYRRTTFGEIVFFKNNCHTLINMEAKEMLANEVRKAFRDVAQFTTWREGLNLLKEQVMETGDISMAYDCLYGTAFSGNWAIYAQSAFMHRNNIEWRVWDVPSKKCPNGFISHIYSSAKGHHVKELKEVKKKSLQNSPARRGTRSKYSYTVARNAIELKHDPNYLHVGEINVKLTELSKKGNKNPTVQDFRRLLIAMKKTNLEVYRRMSQVSTTPHQEDDLLDTEPVPAIVNKSSLYNSLAKQFAYRKNGADKETTDIEVNSDNMDYEPEIEESCADSAVFSQNYDANNSDADEDDETASEVSDNVSSFLNVGVPYCFPKFLTFFFREHC